MFSRTKTLKESFQHFQNLISNTYSIEEARSITQIVFKEVLGYDTIQVILNENELIPASLFEQLDHIAFLLNQNQPVQYVLGFEEFMEMKFTVNSSVLIPRPETEELVLKIIKEHKNNTHLSIIDIGTGSGCIAISLQKNIPTANVSALDVSIDALNIAKLNAKNNQSEINFIHSDILTNILPSTYDIIVSNPPYVLKSEQKLMHKNVLDYEPSLALFVEDQDPLLFYKRIVALANTHLKPKGFLYFEINESYADETLALFDDSNWESAIVWKDIRDKDRMLKAIKK